MKPIATVLFFGALAAEAGAQTLTVDHTCTDSGTVPSAWIDQAKTDLHVAYQHTSHGSQLITGMDCLSVFPDYGERYRWSDDGSSGLDLDDEGIPGCSDLSSGDYLDGHGVTPWVTATRALLDDPANYHVNVVVWSWCSINGHNVQRYLDHMELLISEYGPGGSKARAAQHPVVFVFMTGHAEGEGEYEEYDPGAGTGNVQYNNRRIREHCAGHGRVLFDFADIEAYDPSGSYFWDLEMYDNLDYTQPGAGERNWASQWLAAHPSHELALLTTGDGIAGYGGCTGCAHSDSPSSANLNCILKGRAAWWLFARLAGWSGSGAPTPAPTAPLPTPTPCSLGIYLAGHVYAAGGGKGVEGAEVTLITETHGEISAVASSSGYYQTGVIGADECGPWEYAVTVTAPGYHSRRATLTLPDPDPGAEQDFELALFPAAGGSDFDGDGTVDCALFRDGLWLVRGLTRVRYGAEGDVPVPADYDGDGAVDPAVYRSGVWLVRSFTRWYFGAAGDVPVPADFDGDATADCALFRDGLWAVRGKTRIWFGAAGDLPLAADYGGDGTADFVLYRGSVGKWLHLGESSLWFGGARDLPLVLRSGGGAGAGIFRPGSGLWLSPGGSRVYFGVRGDEPVPAAYDGDGTPDCAVFRNGRWAVRGKTAFYYGREGDLPLSR